MPLDPDHPRPRLQRAGWVSLDGAWDFAFDRECRFSRPDGVPFDRTLRVPFAPETPASGVGDAGFTCACWYRRALDPGGVAPGERLFVRFGAVDWAADVFVDGSLAGRHEGGYTPFGVDVTDLVRGAGPHALAVRAEDDPHDLAQPRGKQTWRREPGAIWYPRTTGIWQTVWLERVPATRIGRVSFTPSVERFEVALEARIEGAPRDDLRLAVRLRCGDRALADDAYAVRDGAVLRSIGLLDPGIHTERGLLLWHPAFPALLEAELELRDAAGAVLDRVSSYTALRSVEARDGRFFLNGRPETLRLALDQGYWPESGLTAPDPAALRRDVELAKALGFDGVRMHQKIEDPRFLYWADRLGLLVFEELPSAYRFSPDAAARLLATWTEAIARDAGHPSVVGWVPMNESWGVPDIATDAAQARLVDALYALTKALDPTRPVIANDGWEVGASDAIGVHDYDTNPETLRARWQAPDGIDAALARERPGGKRLLLDGHACAGRPVLLSEMGGIALSEDGARTWGYARATSSDDLAKRYEALVGAVHASPHLAGFCWTQLTDTYQEANGLLTMDRRPKADVERIRRATRGVR